MSTWPSLTRCATAALANERSLRPSCTVDCEEPVSNSNLEQLITAAELLRPVLDELVFVGGVVTGFLITDTAAGALDVDAVAEIRSYPEYVQFGERLRSLGFVEDTREGAPL